MKKRSRLTIGLVLIMLLVMIAGCGTKTDTQNPETQAPTASESTQETENKGADVEEVTAEQFISKMIAAADGAVVTKSDSKALVQAIVGDNNNYIQIDNLYTSHNEYDKETVASRSDITVENPGGTYNAVYNLVEEQGILYYYATAGDSRIKYEALLEKGDISRNFVTDMNLENAEVLSFETEGVQYNGQDVYKLSVKLKDANIRELVFDSGMKYLFWAKEYATMDLSDITVTMDYYVDPKTAQVWKVEAVLEGMKNLLTECGIYHYSAYFGHVLDVVELHQCKLVYENISYEDYTLPKLSFEDKKNSMTVHQKDTLYTISMLSDQVEVTCPAGWIVSEKDSEYICIESASNDIAIYYFLSFDATSDDLYNDIILGDIEDWKEMGCYLSDSQGEKIGEYDTYGIVVDYGVEAFAYKPVGDSLLVMQVFDYTTQQPEWALEEVVKWAHFPE